MLTPREKILRQIDEIEKALYGMRDVIKIYCLSKATDLTILLLGAHATAKSSLARLWSITTGLNYRIVTSSEVDESLIAYIDPAVFREKNIVQMRRGELMEKNHIIVDEYFLWLNKYRAKLHQLLEERTYAGLESLVYTYTFLSNPLTDYYAGQIEEKNLATMDRIDLFVPVNQPKIVPSETMIRKFSKFGRKERPLEQVISWEDYLRAREEINQVSVPSRIVVWLTLFAHTLASCKHVSDKWFVSPAKMKKLCAGCNENNHICAKVALSKPRFLRATVILAKGLAWLDGRNSVSFEDVNEAIKYTLPHRLVFIQEEKSYTEALDELPELIQQFNDEMLAWKNRGVFTKLAQIIESSKKVPPVYEDAIGQELLADASEVHVLKEFVTETLESVKEDIAKFYEEEGKNRDFSTLKELKLFLEQSGLPLFDREELVYKIASGNDKLYLELPTSPEVIEDLVKKIVTIHRLARVKIDDKVTLMKKFSENVSFDSDLMKIREVKGKIQIVFADKTTKSKFEKGGESNE